MSDNRAIRSLDHARQYAQSARRRIVDTVNKNILIATLDPIGGRCVNRCLHIRAIEVDEGSGRFVGDGTGETEHVPKERAGGGDLVGVEARVDFDGGIVNLVPEVAVWFRRWGGKFTGGGKG